MLVDVGLYIDELGELIILLGYWSYGQNNPDQMQSIRNMLVLWKKFTLFDGW